MNIILLLATVLVFCISGCGSSNGGGTTFFKTVDATAKVNGTSPLLSDLANWENEATRCDGVQSYTAINDVVEFIISTTKSISSGQASNLMLQKATIVFSPADTITPALPPLFATTYVNLVGQSVPADGSLSVPIEIVSHNLKFFFNPCNSAPTYTYEVKVFFDAVEATTGKSGTIPAAMMVHIHDFTD